MLEMDKTPFGYGSRHRTRCLLKLQEILGSVIADKTFRNDKSWKRYEKVFLVSQFLCSLLCTKS